jgi:hypothetical protein
MAERTRSPCDQSTCCTTDHPGLVETRILVAAAIQIHLTTDVSQGVHRSLGRAISRSSSRRVQAWLSEVLVAAHTADNAADNRSRSR